MNENISAMPLIGRFPRAGATIKGSDKYSELSGMINFYNMQEGTFVIAQIKGLPLMNARDMSQGENHSGCFGTPVFGFHIHSGGSCTGTAQNPFANAGLHLNEGDCPHPHHTGDMPPLFGNDGYALSAFYTSRFSPKDVVGHTVIIHANPDDFTTQPSGNSGEMVACGVIESV